MSPFRAGVIGLLGLAAITYLGFTKFANPFAGHYTVHAVFPSANGLRPDNPVRIAGVTIGKVTGISEVPGGGAADVTMTIDDAGLPLHDDATFAIRPRIFLEGNFFIDVNPGTPSSPVSPSGHSFPIQSASEPVQVDQVLTGLQADTRHNLQLLLKELGTGLSKGGSAYNASIRYWLPAYEYTSIVGHDALGVRPHDLSTWIAQMATVSGALDANPPALQSLISDFNTTAGAFARESAALQSAVAELPRTLATAAPALTSLDRALSPLRELARALDPGVRGASRALDVTVPFARQLRLLVRRPELRGLSADLAAAVPPLAKLTRRVIPLMRDGVRPLASCVANTIIPWSHATVPDSTFTAANGFPARPAYVEAVDFLPGLGGESRNFDANGHYIRVLAGGGTLTYSLQPGLFGTALAPLTSVQPVPPPNGTRPPLNENAPCETQPPTTDLSAPAGAPLKAIDTSGGQVPGAARIDRNSQQAAIRMLRRMISAAHLPYLVSDLPALRGSR